VREQSVPIPLICNLAIKVAALQKRAKQQKVILPADVALYIAQNVRSNASALEGALVRLMAHSSVTGTEITLKYTQQVLANFIKA
jgi:chromosomal replication initiator protein